MKNGFNNQNEMLAAQFRPLIDANRIETYPRKSHLDWLIVALSVIALTLIGALWMN
jgi:hypothetical protein